MTQDEMPEFVKLLTTLSLSYGQTLNEFVIERYWQTLERLDLAVVKNALYALTTQNPDKGHFMPQASDVLRYVEGNSQTQALQAWSRVLHIIKAVGSYDSLVFDDSILHKVIEDMGGWIRLCETTTKELSILGHEFQKRYAAYVLHPPLEYPKQLTGRLAWQNSQQGHEEQLPVLIGNAQKAQQVYQQGGNFVAALIHRKPLLLTSSSESTTDNTSEPTTPVEKLEE